MLQSSHGNGLKVTTVEKIVKNFREWMYWHPVTPDLLTGSANLQNARKNRANYFLNQTVDFMCRRHEVMAVNQGDII